MDLARLGTSRVHHRICRVDSVPVTHPFRNVTAHIIEAQLIGIPCLNCLYRPVPIMNGHVGVAVASAVQIPVASRSAPGGEFPLCFRRQAETVARLGVEGRDKVLNFFPGLARDRNGFVGIVVGGAHHLIPHVFGDLGLGKVIPFGQRDLVDGLGVFATHLEGPGHDIEHPKIFIINTQRTAVNISGITIPFIVAAAYRQIRPVAAARSQDIFSEGPFITGRITVLVI